MEVIPKVNNIIIRLADLIMPKIHIHFPSELNVVVDTLSTLNKYVCTLHDNIRM